MKFTGLNELLSLNFFLSDMFNYLASYSYL